MPNLCYVVQGPEKQPDMTRKSTKSTLWRVVVAIAAAAFGASNAWGLGNEPRPGETVTQYLTPEILEALFPGADKVGEVGGIPPRRSGLQGRSPAGFSILNVGRDPIEGFL